MQYSLEFIAPGEAPFRVEPDEAGVVLGRDQTCDIVIPDVRASRRHCLVRPASGGLLVEDLGSANGTLYQGQRLLEPTLLEPGEVFTIGEVEFAVVARSHPLAGVLPHVHAGLPALLLVLLLAAGVLAGRLLGGFLTHRLAGPEPPIHGPGLLAGGASFEAPDPGLGGWEFISVAGTFQAQRVLGGAPGEGERCLEVRPAGITLAGDRAAAYPHRSVPLRPGAAICLEAAVKVPAGAGPAGLGLEFLDARGEVIAGLLGPPVLQTGSWLTSTLPATAPPGTTHVRPQVVAWGGGRGPVCFDAVRMRTLGHAPGFLTLGRPDEGGTPGLRLRVSPDGTFSVLTTGAGVLVRRGTLLSGDVSCTDPLTSQRLAQILVALSGDSRQAELRQRHPGSSLVVGQSFQCTGPGSAEVRADLEMSGALLEVLWVLDLPSGVAVATGGKPLTTRDSPRGGVTELTLTAGDATLLVTSDPEALVRLDDTAAGASLALRLDGDQLAAARGPPVLLLTFALR